MNQIRLFFCLALLCMIAAPSRAQGDLRRYVIDDSNSAVDARVAFLGFGRKTAHFPDLSGSLTLSESNYEAVNMTVDVDARTLTTGDSETRRLRGRQFFDVERYPTVRFTAQRMELTGERTATVTGQVTARGITRPTRILLTFSQAPFSTTGSEALGVIGTTTIDRRQFGMTAFPLLVGNQVQITIRARMVPG
jgi:polyisoprenoid-binding protein YceI